MHTRGTPTCGAWLPHRMEVLRQHPFREHSGFFRNEATSVAPLQQRRGLGCVVTANAGIRNGNGGSPVDIPTRSRTTSSTQSPSSSQSSQTGPGTAALRSRVLSKKRPSSHEPELDAPPNKKRPGQTRTVLSGNGTQQRRRITPSSLQMRKRPILPLARTRTQHTDKKNENGIRSRSVPFHLPCYDKMLDPAYNEEDDDDDDDDDNGSDNGSDNDDSSVKGKEHEQLGKSQGRACGATDEMRAKLALYVKKIAGETPQHSYGGRTVTRVAAAPVKKQAPDLTPRLSVSPSRNQKPTPKTQLPAFQPTEAMWARGWPLPASFRPSPYTVTAGRGHQNCRSEGSVYLQSIIEEHLDAYRTAVNRNVKSAIVTDILHKIRTANNNVGCFVRMKDGRYWEIPDGEAREKIGAIFRNKLSELYRSSTQQKMDKRKHIKKRTTG